MQLGASLAVEATATAVQSMFSALEPTAGMSLAINLAYLNLPMFRYRHEIRVDAESRLSKLRSDNELDDGTVDHLDQYNEIRYLAEEEGGKRPSGPLIAVYAAVFGNRLDIYFSVAFAIYAAILVFIGAAHNFELWQFVPHRIGSVLASFIFYFLALSVAVPPLLVAVGRRAKQWAWRRTLHCSQQIAAIYEAKASSAKPPPLAVDPPPLAVDIPDLA